MMTVQPTIRLKSCPSEGQGVHSWLYYAACTLTDAGVPSEEAEAIIEELMTRPPKPASEVEDALRSARGERKPGPRWTPALPHRISEVAQAGASLRELVSRSPLPVQFGQVSKTEEYIDRLFPGDPWLCVGRADSDFYTSRRELWRGRLSERALIVPSQHRANKTALRKTNARIYRDGKYFSSSEFDGLMIDCRVPQVVSG